MIQVNALGDACPLPVIKTMHALKELGGAGTVEVLVDNEIAVQNLTRLADNKHCTIETEKRSEKEYRVTITAGEAVEETGDEETLCTIPTAQKKVVVVISADHMGEGNDELGKILLKGFLFALTQQEKLPSIARAGLLPLARFGIIPERPLRIHGRRVFKRVALVQSSCLHVACNIKRQPGGIALLLDGVCAFTVRNNNVVAFGRRRT